MSHRDDQVPGASSSAKTMDDAPSVTLHPGQPTLEEGRAFARYLDQAAEGFFRFWLGSRFVEIVAVAYLERDHDLSFQHVTFARSGSAFVGMILAYTAEQHRRSTRQPLEQAAGRFPLRMTLVAIVLAPMFRILETIDEGDFYIQAVAVDPAARGQGVGSALLDSVEEKAAASGATRISLDVAGTNKAAQRLYERRGMVVESRWPRRLRLPRIEFLRMAKEV